MIYRGAESNVDLGMQVVEALVQRKFASAQTALVCSHTGFVALS